MGNLNKLEIRVRRRSSLQKCCAPSFLIQLLFFRTFLALLGALTNANKVSGVSNSPFKDTKLLRPDNQDITHVHVTDLAPAVLTEVGCLCELAVSALHFDDAAALVQPGFLVALLGNVSFGP